MVGPTFRPPRGKHLELPSGAPTAATQDATARLPDSHGGGRRRLGEVTEPIPTVFYRCDGDAFVPTALTRGPWSHRLAHGGPPAALLGRAIERFEPDPGGFFVSRVTVDFLRPIPLDPVHVTTKPIRMGRQAQRIEASLWAGDDELARAVGLRIRRASLELPPGTCEPLPPPALPETLEPWEFPFFGSSTGYQTAVEVRIARGPWGQGPAAAWLRSRVPLIEGEPTSSLEQVLITADAINGVCPVLPLGDFTFMNADLTVTLRREVEGDWVGLDARSLADPSGVGLGQSEIFDTRGECGRAVQSLVLAPAKTNR